MAIVMIWSSWGASLAHAQNTNWIEWPGIKLQTLDKITARIATIDLVIDEPVRFGTLHIIARYCATTPPEAPPETAAFLEIRDQGYDIIQGDNIQDAPLQNNTIQGDGLSTDLGTDLGTDWGQALDDDVVFSGWMFASSPAVSSLEHSVYDVTVLACAR